MLFSDQKKHEITVPSQDKDKQPSTIKFLVNYLCEKLMKDPRKELFVLDDSVYAIFSRQASHQGTNFESAVLES